MRDIKRRIEKLEATYRPLEDRECIVFLLVSYLQGKLTAIEGHGITVNRLPVETEEQLRERAEVEVKKTAPLDCSKDGLATFMMSEVRERSGSDDDWKQHMGVAPTEPEKQPEPPKPDPELPEPRRPYVPERKPEHRPVIEIKRPIGPTAGHWLLG
jgi:hypothetical protein